MNVNHIKRWTLAATLIASVGLFFIYKLWGPEHPHYPTEESVELPVNAWLTTGDMSNLLTPQSPIDWDSDEISNQSSETKNENKIIVKIDEEETFQTMEGFGASMTGSSAYLINNKLTSEQRENLLEDLFTQKGINLNFIRHTIGASDFSVNKEGEPINYTYDDVASNDDDDLNDFSTTLDADVIQVLQDMLAKNSHIKVLGTPWTAPPWMKYGSQEHNGWYLNYTEPQVYSAYAAYFVKYLKAYAEEGIPVYAMTIQNEPEHTTPHYPSMSMGANEQQMFIRDYLGPTFSDEGLPTKIITFDHNWDTGADYADTVLGDAEANNFTAGTAFHCYAGDPSTMSEVHDAFPDKHIYVTECSGGEWSPNFGDNLSWNMSNLMIGSVRNWAESVLMWNMALDPEGGPTNGGCQDCRGVVTIDPENGEIVKNVEYYSLGHASQFVQRGAIRIQSTQVKGEIETVAFRNPDHTYVLIASNPSQEERSFEVQQESRSFTYTLPPQSAVTYTWELTAEEK